MKKHQHRAKTHETYGWSHCVGDGSRCGAAHGAVTHVDTCACGSIRRTESNGMHVARGAWETGEEGRQADARDRAEVEKAHAARTGEIWETAFERGQSLSDENSHEPR